MRCDAMRFILFWCGALVEKTSLKREPLSFFSVCAEFSLLFCLLFVSGAGFAAADGASMSLGASSFQKNGEIKVEEVRIEGLQRISASLVLRELLFRVGDRVSQEKIASAIHRLFATGNFDDVQVLREDNVLIISVSERPTISKIDFEGNKLIDTDTLKEGLKQSGLQKGNVFQRASLDRVKVELERQYIAQGRYGARVKSEAVPLPDNKVKLKITIQEGNAASIAHMNIVGNQRFSDEQLLGAFQLKKKHFWSFFKGDDKYAKEKLAGDLEALRSYYLDRGYVNFTIESTQVSISPNRERVYIAVNISEGEQFKLGKVSLVGKLPIDEKELSKLILLKTEQVFSQNTITLTENLLSKRLGNEGYTFARVKGVPDITTKNDRVDINFYVDAGKRMSVRRINFAGNEKTEDQVLRREMRQMEGTWASSALIDRSRARLEQLGFFKRGVGVDMNKVPGTEDQLDVDFSVEEQPSGSIGASVGYQIDVGLIFSADVKQTNFLGTGNQVAFALQRNKFRNSYNFSYLNPYFTVDGISRGYNFYFNETDYAEANLSNFSSDAVGANVRFGYPISEEERLSFSVGFDKTTIKANTFSSLEVVDFIGGSYPLASGTTAEKDFSTVNVISSWRRSTLNAGLLPDRGASHNLSFELAVPGIDVEYYKLTYQGEKYLPLTRSLTFRLSTDLGYGDGYSDTERLPFYKHFYAGGIGSVRGYDSRSLGPKDTALPPDPFGGNILTAGSIELIFPAPFVKDKRMVRTVLFLDGGNVFDSNRDSELGLEISADQFRYALGFGLTWVTPIGPISLTLARALRDQPGDEPRTFDFSLGFGF